MLKVRMIPTLLYKDMGLVKGVAFDSWRPIGSLMQAIKVYNMREVDELLYLDISATNMKKSPDFQLIDDFADECFMPLTIGGGIRNIKDIEHLLKVGADKVSINTAAFLSTSLITEASNKFGAQCIVVSIDVKRIDSKYKVFIHSGKVATDMDLLEYAKMVEKFGAGEILLTSIDRDGTMIGYDNELIKYITSNVSIPVIASGGAGKYDHMLQAIKIAHASAVAAASIFHFTEQTPLQAKKYLRKRGIKVRY